MDPQRAYAVKVLDALVSVPAVWEKTALIISYDENSGYTRAALPHYP